MEFIIDLRIADTAVNGRFIIFLFKHGNRVGQTDINRRNLVSLLLHIHKVSVSVRVAFHIDRLCGVILGSQTDSCTVGKTVLVVHSLHIQLDVELLVEEVGVQVNGTCQTLHVRSLQDTVFVCIRHRHTIRHMRNGSGYTYIMVGAESRAEYFILPVGRGFAQSVGLKTILAKLLDHEITEIVCLHHIDRIRLRTDRERAAVVHLHASRLSLLGGNDDNTIGGTRTVNSSSRGIFQNRKRLDVIGVDGRERIAHTFDFGVIDRHPVNNDQRVVAGRHGRTSAHTDRSPGSRSAAVGNHADTCGLTHQQVGSRSSHTFYHLVRIDCHHRAGHVILLHGTITDHHRFLKHHRIILEGHRHTGSSFHFNRLVTDERNHEGRMLRNTQNKVSVQIGNRTDRRIILHNHIRADYGFTR